MEPNFDQITLRVKRNSKTEKLIRHLLSTGGSSESTLFKADFTKRLPWVVASLSKDIDNLTIRQTTGADSRPFYTAAYNELSPRPTPIIINNPTSSVVPSEVAGLLPEVTQVEDIRWPDCPPVPTSMGAKYREPSWFKLMETMVHSGRHVSLAGAPGVGKDTAVIELAAEYEKPLVFVGGDAGFRKRDLVGSTQIVNGRSFFDVAEYAAAAVNGWWVIISEVNAADADALLFLNQQIAAPYSVQIGGRGYPVHKDFRLFVTYNPGLVGTKPLPQSFKDRFYSIQVPWFDSSALKGILVSHGMNAENSWAGDLVEIGLAIWDAHERGAIRYQVTSRRLQDAVELMQKEVVTNLVQALNYAVVSAIDSPVESNTVKQLIKSKAAELAAKNGKF